MGGGFMITITLESYNNSAKVNNNEVLSYAHSDEYFLNSFPALPLGKNVLFSTPSKSG